MGAVVRRVPPAPIVSAALSGFVVGVFATLLATGTIIHSSAAGPASPTPAPTVLPESLLKGRIWRIAARELGPSTYPSTKTPRVLNVGVSPVLLGEGSGSVARDSDYHSILIRFRLDDHPLGKPWRLKAAKRDIFAVMKALYISGLPVYDIEMDGWFPLPGPKGPQMQRVLVAYLAHDQATAVPWRHWGRESEGRLWSRLTIKRVDPRFA